MIDKTQATEDKKAKKSTPKKLKFKNIKEAVNLVAKIADEKKAPHVKVLDVSSRLIITDYFIIIVAANTRLTRSIAEEIGHVLKKYETYPLNVDGTSEGNWILMDYDDFIVHIFTEEYSNYYDLERLWRDSKAIRIKAPDKKNTD